MLTESDLAAIEAAVESQVGPIYETAGVDLRLVPIEREPIFLPRQSVCALLADLRAAYSTINEQDREIARLKNRLEQANVEPD